MNLITENGQFLLIESGEPLITEDGIDSDPGAIQSRGIVSLNARGGLSGGVASIPLQSAAHCALVARGVVRRGNRLNAHGIASLQARGGLSHWIPTVTLQSAAHCALVARGQWNGGIKLQSAAHCALVARGIVRGGNKLHSRGSVSLNARGGLSGGIASIPLQGAAHCALVARGGLSGGIAVIPMVPLQSAAHCALVARGGFGESIRTLTGLGLLMIRARDSGTVVAPRLRGQRLNDKLIASVYAHPAVIRLAWALDDAPLTDIPITLLNPNAGQPLILDIPGFQAPVDPVLHRCTIQVWQAAGERTSSRASVVVDLKPTKATALKPPKTVTATQVRDWTPYYRDLTRIEWDWGDEAPGMVEVFAYIRPVGSQNRTKRELKNISLGVVDANTRQFMAESIGIKINWSGATRVYFGVARYLNGERSPELISNEVYISASVNEDVTTPVYNPDLESGTVKTWTQTQLVNAVSQQLAIDSITVEQILNAALLKMKDVVAKGGSVAIEDVGTFDVLWSDPIVRVDRVTGKTTTTPAQRNARFIPSPGFKLGTQRGSVSSDDDVIE